MGFRLVIANDGWKNVTERLADNRPIAGAEQESRAGRLQELRPARDILGQYVFFAEKDGMAYLRSRMSP